MIRPQFILDLHSELIVDNFAGGGGASTGAELALGRCVDIAVNHDPEALAMHALNHPQTRHLQEDVFQVNPREVTGGRPVGLAWFSPDCKHFSKAKGGKPRSKKIRGLAWVALKWASMVRPRVIIIENVEEFKTWGPLLPDGKPDPAQRGRTYEAFRAALTTGLAPEHPDFAEIEEHLGEAFCRDQIEAGLGYAFEARELKAYEYGAPTIRKRLFIILRCDGKPIVWPAPTHGRPDSEGVRSGKLKPWRTAAECIDWSIRCPSIFERKKPLAEATLRRIARGLAKFVFGAAKPFIVEYHSAKRPGDDRVRPLEEPIATQTVENRFAVALPYVAPVTHPGDARVYGPEEPFRTVTGAHRGEMALIAPVLTECANGSHERVFPIGEPLRTQCAETKGGHFALATAHVTKFRTGSTGSACDEPLHTVTAGPKENPAGAAHAMGLVTAHVTKFVTGSTGHEATEPLHTITAGQCDHPGGNAHAMGVVTATLMGAGGSAYGGKPRAIDAPAGSQTTENHTAVVAATLVNTANGKYDGAPSRSRDVAEPLNTITGGGQKHAAIAATLVQTGYGEREGQAPRVPGLNVPLGTVVAEGTKHAAVAAFLAKHYSGEQLHASSGEEPVHTVTSVDHNALVTANLVGCGGRAAQSPPRSVEEPTGTGTAKADSCLVTAHLQRDFGQSVGHGADAPSATVTAGAAGHSALVTSHLAKLYGTTTGQPATEPMHTVTGGGNHIAEVRAFLIKYYGTGEGQGLDVPAHAVTAKDRLGLVVIEGQEYVITDIGMRMLEPHELYAAQGFPPEYLIQPQVPDKRRSKPGAPVFKALPKDAQVRMCGNSVCPPLAQALVAANVPELSAWAPGDRKAKRRAA